jgi:hypothetical protein
MSLRTLAHRVAALECRQGRHGPELARQILEFLMQADEATDGGDVDHLREGQRYDRGGVLSETSRPAADHWYFGAWSELRAEALAQRDAARAAERPQ